MEIGAGGRLTEVNGVRSWDPSQGGDTTGPVVCGVGLLLPHSFLSPGQDPVAKLGVSQVPAKTFGAQLLTLTSDWDGRHPQDPLKMIILCFKTARGGWGWAGMRPQASELCTQTSWATLALDL